MMGQIDVAAIAASPNWEPIPRCSERGALPLEWTARGQAFPTVENQTT